VKPHRDFKSSREALNGPAPRTWCRAFNVSLHQSREMPPPSREIRAQSREIRIHARDPTLQVRKPTPWVRDPTLQVRESSA